jgi:hypothetical protein
MLHGVCSLTANIRVELTSGPAGAGPSAAHAGRSALLTTQTFCYIGRVKFTRYFLAIRGRPDRAVIRDEWIERAINSPIREFVQTDGRIRRWVQVPEMEGRYLRVVLLPDGETVHNAFFDRGFEA